MVYSNTVEGAGRAMELDGALQTFAGTVEVAEALRDGTVSWPSSWKTWEASRAGDLGWSGC